MRHSQLIDYRTIELVLQGPLIGPISKGSDIVILPL